MAHNFDRYYRHLPFSVIFVAFLNDKLGMVYSPRSPHSKVICRTAYRYVDGLDYQSNGNLDHRYGIAVVTVSGDVKLGLDSVS